MIPRFWHWQRNVNGYSFHTTSARCPLIFVPSETLVSGALVFPYSSKPRCWDRDRRTAAHLARIGGIGVGRPVNVAATLALEHLHWAGREPASPLLEHVPKVLSVDLVVILHFRRLHDRAERTGTAVCRSLFQIGVAGLHILTKELCGPLRFIEVVDCIINIIRQET